MSRTKLQRILNKLDGKNEATMKVISDFDVSVKALRDKLEQDISVATLEEVKKQISKLRKTINLYPLLEEVKNLQENFKENALFTLKEVEDKTKELKTLVSLGDAELESKIGDIIKETRTLGGGLADLSKSSKEFLLKTTESLSSIEKKLPTLADKKETKDAIEEIKYEKDKVREELKDYTDKTRIEILGKMVGGGNANRNIAIGGNVSVLGKYTDLNIKAGSNVTLTYSNNNTTKYVDLTITSTGGGSVGGTVRSINRISTSQTADNVTGTDYVYIATVGINLILPTAVSNTNLYTIKNVAASSVLISTTGGQTIDTDSNLILATQFTAVDLINDGNDNWSIT